MAEFLNCAVDGGEKPLEGYDYPLMSGQVFVPKAQNTAGVETLLAQGID